MATTQHKPTASPTSNPAAESECVAARRFTRRLATSHYENFLVTSVLLPRPMRQPFYDLYAFCRTADDLADQSGDPATALAALQQLRQQVDAMFAGRPTGSVMIALAATAADFNLATQPMHDLIDAFEQDQTKTSYRDDAELSDYCRRSACPVGRMVLRLADADCEQNVAASDRICEGLQRINFWQDIARDLAIGRTYIPADRMQEFAVRPKDLAASKSPANVVALVRALVDETRDLFLPAEELSRSVPAWLSPSIHLFAAGGRATCDAIARARYDVLARRPVVRRRTQIKLISKEIWRKIRGGF